MALKITDFSLHVEKIKKEMQLVTYLEAIIWIVENDVSMDVEIESIPHLINEKIKSSLENEGVDLGLLKPTSNLKLF